MARQEPTHDISPGLLRQRRNLFVASLIALFAYFADATVSSITAMGTQISFGRPQMLPLFLLVIQAYYIIRYYQYLQHEGNLGIVNAFYNEVRRYSMSDLIERKNAKYPEAVEYGADFDLRQMKPKSRWIRTASVPAQRNTLGEISYGDLDVDVRKYWIEMLRAALFVVTRTSYITDYFLPFIVGIAGIIANIQLLAI